MTTTTARDRHRSLVPAFPRRMRLGLNAACAALLAATTLNATAATTTPPTQDAQAMEMARNSAAHFAAKRYAEALTDANRALDLKTDEPALFMLRAFIEHEQGNPLPALQDTTEALRLRPDLPEARVFRARLRSVLGDHSGAADDIARAVPLIPPEAELRVELARYYDYYDQPSEAVRQWELWLSHRPGDADQRIGLNERCWLRARRGMELPLALHDCQRAAALPGSTPAPFDSLGWTQLRIGDLVAAKAAFDASLGMKADHVWSLYGRGLTALKAGDAQAAERDLRAARLLKPAIGMEVREAGFEVPDGVE